MIIKPGVELLSESAGEGPAVVRHNHYQIRLRMWLRRGEPVRWLQPWGLIDHSCIEEDGAALTTVVRVDRVSLFAGLFYGILGMHVGGTRTLRVAPHLGFGERGLPGVIPENALLTVEVAVLSAGRRRTGSYRLATGLPGSGRDQPRRSSLTNGTNRVEPIPGGRRKRFLSSALPAEGISRPVTAQAYHGPVRRESLKRSAHGQAAGT